MPDTEGTTAARVLDLLAELEITTAFGLPGVHNLAFWDARLSDGRLSDGRFSDGQASGRPRIVGVRHEQSAGYAADGLARATGGLGVALTTTGPGAANAVAAVGEAAASGSPVLLIASDAPIGLRRPGVVRGLLHESRDQGAIFAPLVKQVWQPTTPEAAVAAVAEAARVAMTHPRGPVYVGIPSDVLPAAAPPATAQPVPLPPAPDHAVIGSAVHLVEECARVVIWAGGGAVASEAGMAVDGLARRLGAPVVTTFAARGLLGDSHPLDVGAPPHEPEIAQLIGSADLLVVVGSQLDGMNTRNWTMPRPARMLVINIDGIEATKNYDPDIVVVGDARVACEMLATALAQRPCPWFADPAALGALIRSRIAGDPDGRALSLVSSIERAWPVEGNIVTDMAVAGYWVGGYARTQRPRRLQYPVGWGTLGYALPAAVGAAAGATPTLAVCGDGGLMFAVGELATIKQETLPLTILVFDDGGYGMLRYDQDRAARPHVGVDLTGPDLVALAKSFAISATTSALDDLSTLLVSAAAAHGPSMIVVREALTPPRTTSPRWQDPNQFGHC